jgi:hypothetical protein
MKKIGQGWQFNVYKKGRKVIKTPTSKYQIKLRLLLWAPSYLLRPLKLEAETKRREKEREKVLQEIKKRKVKSSLLANLSIHGDKIEQDIVRPLGKYLREYKTAKKRIDDYIDFIFDCWRNGFSERTYNLTINNGINSGGEIVLMDFGEITFKKSDVEREIKSKKWCNSWSFKKDLTKKVRQYYEKQMKENLTISNLRRYWNTITKFK